ncbi:MAG: 2Fe-2S iron-sulfur cluster-binding protein [Gammaproteobacteria bacterium]|nr:2Fe-2S iron-sulfur cluster-binding protein [Gammaproteobacteria bacterium]
MSTVAVLRIARGEAGDADRFEVFEVPYTHGQSILDGLMWIREHADPSLAFRFACINANVCKECVMRIDGKNGYACTERLKPGETVLEPLANKRRIRDLACDTVPPKERLVSG